MIYKKVADYYKEYGFRRFIRKATLKIKHIVKKEDINYFRWRKNNNLTEEMIRYQREFKFENYPLISVVVPTYNTSPVFLSELIQSVQQQTYRNWELLIADGNSKEETRMCISRFADRDQRIKPVFLNMNGGISANTNAAVNSANGEFIVFSDHDDIITPDALFEIVSAFLSTDADFVYSDEDRIDEQSRRLFSPRFKPDFSPELILSLNYICHISAIRRDKLVALGGLNSTFDGSQDHDLNIRVAENHLKILHIPKVLYHWRTFKKSYSNQYLDHCFEAARASVKAHFNRMGIQADSVQQNNRNRVIYKIIGEPQVSIILTGEKPKEDQQSFIANHTAYSNYEFAENSEIAKGEYLVFIAGSVFPQYEIWLSELLMYAQLNEIGAVGGAVFDHWGRTVHRGIHFNGKRAVSSFKGAMDVDNCFMNICAYVHNVSAVDGGFCITRKRDYCAYLKEYKDKDFVQYCLYLYQQNYRIVFTPFSVATVKKGAKYNMLIDKEYKLPFLHDPFYNRNLVVFNPII